MSWTDPALQTVAALVSQRTGLSFDSRQQNAEVGIRKGMAQAGLGAARYTELIATDEQAFDDLVSELTVGETYFFREAAHFEFIRRQVLPDIQLRRGPGHPPRVWSAACASGEEAYSLAILLAEAGWAQTAQVAATDISRSGLAKARQAVFGAWSLRGDDAQAALPYLSLTDKGYRLADKIQRLVRFGYLNLALDAYPSFAVGIWGMDVILCRNVLIYFDRATVSQVARRLFRALAPGGWLLTASSDPPLWDDAAFEVVSRDEGLFYRRPDSAVTMSAPQPEPSAEESLPAWRDIVVDPVAKEDVPSADPVETARQALACGDWQHAARMTEGLLDNDAAAILHVRALANLGTAAALEAAEQALGRHALSAELHYLHAVLLVDLGRSDEAVKAMRNVVYLDRSLAAAHFALGSILRQRGDLAGAQRAYRNARDLCAACPAAEPVPLADGETAGRLAAVAAAELAT